MEQTLTGYPSIDKPWLKYYSQEAINAPLPESTVYEYLWENNKNHPNDIAIIYFNRKITYGELFQNIDKTASALVALGVKKGEIVTVAMPSIPEALYIVYALNKIGAVANMIHPLAGEKEIVHYLNEVESRVAILFDGTYSIIKNAIPQTSIQHAVVVTAGESLPLGLKQLYRLKSGRLQLAGPLFVAWRDFIRGGRGLPVPVVKKDCSTMAIISHTGGTTGEPKGVMCSDYGCNALMFQLLCNFSFDRQECSLNSLPPFINYSLLESIMAMLAVGFVVVLIPKYEPMQFAKYIKRYMPNQILSIPAYWKALLQIDNIEKVDMSCLKHIYSGGETIDPTVEMKLNELFERCGAKTKLYNCMGSTEMMAGATIIYDECYKRGSVGIPMVKVDCKIVEPESDIELSYGIEGEICFSGATLMSGYFNNISATNDVIKLHQDNKRWLHTGDIGYMDEDGVLFITGRIKRIIMTKGEDGNITKLFPDRIEKAIGAHPAVECCCAVGVPDEKRIHIPAAYVVLKPDHPQRDRMETEIMDLCRDSLPAYMAPERIEFCDSLPRTSRGKIDYRALEEQAIKKN